MPDAPAYPLVRHRSRRRIRLPRLSGGRLAAVAVLALVVVLAAVVALRPAARVDPLRAYADGVAAYRAGNYSAARNHARAAIEADPASGAAHLLLARSYLQLGEGLAAEAELARAGDAGVRPGALHGYRAQARFLQADADGAIEEADKASQSDPQALRTRARAMGVGGDNDRAVALLAGLVAAHPRNGGAWADLGRLFLAAGDVGDAAQASARAIRAAPADPIALTLQGEVVRARFGLIAALPWFEAALARDAYFHPALIEYAATLGEAGRYADMLAATRHALAARPGSPQALYLQAVLAVRAGKPDLARSLMEKTRGQVDALPGGMLLQGALAFADDKDEIAIRYWRALVAAQPMNLVAHRLLAAALLRSGDAAGALDVLRPMAIRGDADAYTLTLAARAFERTGDRGMAARLLDGAASVRRAPAAIFTPDQALGALIADAAQAPADPTYAVGIIRGQIQAGDIAGGIARARSLAAATPGSPAAHLALGDALVAGERYGEAVGAYQRAADLAFDEPTLLRLVDAQGRVGRPRDAAATLALYLQQNPQSVMARRVLGHWQVANGAADAAIETLEGVRRATGNRDAALLSDLALAYAATDDGPIARRYGRAAYALAPMGSAAADAYGVALAADGDIAAARQLLTKAAALDPRNAAIAAHLRAISH